MTLGRPERIVVAKVANDVLGALAAVVVAALSARIVRRRGVAIVSGFVFALMPTQVLIATDVQTEPLFILLLLCTGYLFLASTDRPSSNLALLAGGFLGAAALTRSSALMLPPLLLAPLGDRRYPLRVGAHLALSALLGFGLILSPWTLRNFLVFGELIVVNDGAGCVFYGRNSDVALGAARARNREEIDRAAVRIQQVLMEKIASLSRDVGDSPGRLSQALTHAALEERRANPAGTRRLIVWKAWSWLRPYPDPRYWPGWAVAGVGAFFIALYALVGIGLARAQRRGVAGLCLLFLALSMLVHVALESSWRYRTTYWDPVLVIYGVLGMVLLGARLRVTGRLRPSGSR